MSWPETIGLITGVLTIAGVLVAVTRYVTLLQSQVRLETLEADKAEADNTRSDLAATNKLLLEELAFARRTGAEVSAKKAEIDTELSSLMKLTSAGGGSVYLPLVQADSDQPAGLVFLSIRPVTQQTMKLRKKIIPMHSLAGKCFKDARSIMLANSKASPDHYAKADEVSGYKTQDILSVPLRSNNEIVGVLQLMNKLGSENFSEHDLTKTQQLSTKLARRVTEFSAIPEHLDILGVTADRKNEYATILFCDLTASSQLFRELNVSAAIHHINEYLEGLCNVAFRYGATVDKYMGDGVLFRFNVPHPVDEHPTVAVRAALEMRDVFDTIKKDWLTMGDVLSGVYTRSGLAYGPVQRATIGHPQYQYLTIFGTAVNAAVNLCENSARDRNVVVIDEELYRQLPDTVRVDQLPTASLGKAQHYARSAYEVLQM